MALSAGRLRQRVDIVRMTEVDTGKGGYTSVPIAIAAKVPAEVIGLTGREGVLEKVLQGTEVFQITLRWRSDLMPKDQLRYGGRDLNIRSSVDPDGRQRELRIVADTAAVLAAA